MTLDVKFGRTKILESESRFYKNRVGELQYKLNKSNEKYNDLQKKYNHIKYTFTCVVIFCTIILCGIIILQICLKT